MIPPILCKRAAEILHGLETTQLQVTADEIEQLLKAGLAVEADPEHIVAAQRLAKLRDEFSEHFTGDLLDPASYKSALDDIETKLKSEWYRLRTSDERIREHEAHRAELRRALGLLHDPAALAAMRKLMSDAQFLAPGARYAVCPSLGVEAYAMTAFGQRVQRDLLVRLGRVGDATLASFLKSFQKTEAKMQAFGREVAYLKSHVGFVRKNPEQVLIGLAKTGLPPDQAIGTYQAALSGTRAPDVAVICARNAKQLGSPDQVAARLRKAGGALIREGFPNTPEVMGAAKTLLAFDPPHAGVPRFTELYRRIRASFGDGPHVFKFIVRLMPAAGTPAELVNRAANTTHVLRAHPSHVKRRHDLAAPAVAISAMVKNDQAVAAAVMRLREIETELARHQISSPALAEQHALECLACPGTPVEVVSSVRSLCQNLAPEWPPTPATSAIAVSFAKRFAY